MQNYAEALAPFPPSPKGALSPLTKPIEALLREGGDARLTLDPKTKRDRYGTAAEPRPALRFGSCTASAVTVRGYLAAERSRLRMLADAPRMGMEATLAAATDFVEQEILRFFAAENLAQCVLAPSGTDAIALGTRLLAAPLGRAPAKVIMMAEEETGSHVPKAVRAVVTSAELHHIPLRSPDGMPREPGKVAEDCADLIGPGSEPILLHLIDCSKTGLTAPLPKDAAALQASFAGLEVMVDACQGRLSVSALHDYLARGWPVALTGSKFFGGPPFSGALLIPRARPFRPEWRAPASAGLLCRWAAALAEMNCFRAISQAAFAAKLQGLRSTLRGYAAAHPGITLLPTYGQDGETSDWGQTIFTLALRHPLHPERFLGKEILYAIYQAMGEDGLGRQNHAFPACEIGQPVMAGAVPALRIAFGAALESEADLMVCLDKLAWARDQVAGVPFHPLAFAQ